MTGAQPGAGRSRLRTDPLRLRSAAPRQFSYPSGYEMPINSERKVWRMPFVPHLVKLNSLCLTLTVILTRG
jgi:hypothetical protein